MSYHYPISGQSQVDKSVKSMIRSSYQSYVTKCQNATDPDSIEGLAREIMATDLPPEQKMALAKILYHSLWLCEKNHNKDSSLRDIFGFGSDEDVESSPQESTIFNEDREDTSTDALWGNEDESRGVE